MMGCKVLMVESGERCPTVRSEDRGKESVFLSGPAHNANRDCADYNTNVVNRGLGLSEASLNCLPEAASLTSVRSITDGCVKYPGEIEAPSRLKKKVYIVYTWKFSVQ